LQIKVRPGAARNEIVGLDGGVLQVKIAAPPEKGKANRELTDFLSSLLGINKSSITIVKGETARSKFITLDGFSPEEALKRLSNSF
jgi:uncharacterized protein (TIGR00251 family)